MAGIIIVSAFIAWMLMAAIVVVGASMISSQASRREEAAGQPQRRRAARFRLRKRDRHSRPTVPRSAVLSK